MDLISIREFTYFGTIAPITAMLLNEHCGAPSLPCDLKMPEKERQGYDIITWAWLMEGYWI